MDTHNTHNTTHNTLRERGRKDEDWSISTLTLLDHALEVDTLVVCKQVESDVMVVFLLKYQTIGKGLVICVNQEHRHPLNIFLV